MQLNAFTFQLLEETTGQETSGFIQTFVLTEKTLMLCFFYLVIGITECLCYLKLKKDSLTIREQHWRRRDSIILVSVISLCLVMCSEMRFFSPNRSYNFFRSDKLIKRTQMWELAQAWWQYQDYKADFALCAESQYGIEIDSVAYRSKNIVLIIGETFNRHHSSLYGYPLPTNPRLSNDSLYIFSDVITTLNATTTAFRNFMSFMHIGDSVRWCNTPLFPAVFKTAGYNVLFWSNQFVVERDVNIYDASEGFFNHPKIAPSLFNNKNTRKYQFDGQLIDDFISHREENEKDSLNLVIFHLYGQHYPAIERFPWSEIQFSASDIPRPDLTLEQRQYVADYDNATLYNDQIVGRIIDLYRNMDAIVIYFADHGEEIYDFRPKAGRFFDIETAGAPCLQNQMDIPFVIFMSEKYKSTHPDIVKSVEESLDRPFMTDDLPHLLLDLAGIHTQWFIPSRSLINEKFDASRKRIIYGTQIDYDVVCGK